MRKCKEEALDRLLRGLGFRVCLLEDVRYLEADFRITAVLGNETAAEGFLGLTIPPNAGRLWVAKLPKRRIRA